MDPLRRIIKWKCRISSHFSDINGLYDKDPKKDENAKLIKNIDKITKDIEKLAVKSKSKLGTGGMESKILAAKLAVNAGIDVVIANGKNKNFISELSKNDQFSFFKASDKSLSSKKKWLSNLKSKNIISIDQGALKAIKNGNSLLPVGVTKIEGSFVRGDIVNLKYNRKIVAKGIVNISNQELKDVMDKNKDQIISQLKKPTRLSIIHIDNLVLI